MQAEEVRDGVSPRFTHDCPACTFLGRHGEADLYHCLQSGLLPTVIARHSSSGPDYLSGLAAADIVPALGEARERARARGLALA